MVKHDLVETSRSLRSMLCSLGMESLSDGELLKRFVERRDEDAFATLVMRHGPLVMGVCQANAVEPAGCRRCFSSDLSRTIPPRGFSRPAWQLGQLVVYGRLPRSRQSKVFNFSPTGHGKANR